MPVLLILMVKNEALIIKRCMDSAASFVDAFFVLDTGSDDETCEVVENLNFTKPVKLARTKFQTFGISRTESFRLAKKFIDEECGWDLNMSYALLLDADMVFKLGNFDKQTIYNYDEYRIIQRQYGVEYHNIRIIKMSFDWKCVGSTHEAWICSSDIKTAVFMSGEKMWIDDVSDGGCKIGKLERDEKFLELDLAQSLAENNLFQKQRTTYYLAQTYRCLEKYEKSIEMYLQRIELGGWPEEIWASYYNISHIYSILDNLEKTIEYGVKAYDYDITRADPLSLVSHAYLLKGDYENALKYVNIGIHMNKNPMRLIQCDIKVYKYVFYELKFTILTKIPTTTVNELLDVGLNMINRTPSGNYISAIFASVIHQISLNMEFTKIENGCSYIEVIAEHIGQSTVIYNKDRKKVYTPVLLDAQYKCLGITDEMCLIVSKDNDLYKSTTELEMFDIK